MNFTEPIGVLAINGGKRIDSDSRQSLDFLELKDVFKLQKKGEMLVLKS